MVFSVYDNNIFPFFREFNVISFEKFKFYFKSWTLQRMSRMAKHVSKAGKWRRCVFLSGIVFCFWLGNREYEVALVWKWAGKFIFVFTAAISRNVAAMFFSSEGAQYSN